MKAIIGPLIPICIVWGHIKKKKKEIGLVHVGRFFSSRRIAGVDQND